MWIQRKSCIFIIRRFFRLGLGYADLAIYYKNLWILSYKSGYSLEDIYKMMPYERDIFMEFIIKDLEKKLARMKITVGAEFFLIGIFFSDFIKAVLFEFLKLPNSPGCFITNQFRFVSKYQIRCSWRSIFDKGVAALWRGTFTDTKNVFKYILTNFKIFVPVLHLFLIIRLSLKVSNQVIVDKLGISY